MADDVMVFSVVDSKPRKSPDTIIAQAIVRTPLATDAGPEVVATRRQTRGLGLPQGDCRAMDDKSLFAAFVHPVGEFNPVAGEAKTSGIAAAKAKLGQI